MGSLAFIKQKQKNWARWHLEHMPNKQEKNSTQKKGKYTWIWCVSKLCKHSSWTCANAQYIYSIYIYTKVSMYMIHNEQMQTSKWPYKQNDQIIHVSMNLMDLMDSWYWVLPKMCVCVWAIFLLQDNTTSVVKAGSSKQFSQYLYRVTFKLLCTHDINLPDVSFLPSVLSRPLFASSTASTCGAGACGTGTTAFYLTCGDSTPGVPNLENTLENHGEPKLSMKMP